MARKFTNFADSVLVQSALASDTTIYIDTDDDDFFPTLGVGDTFRAIIYDGTNKEIVVCTARTANALVVSRGQESTTARAWAAGARVRHTITANDLEQVLASAASVSYEGTATGTNAYTVTLSSGAAIPTLARGERVVVTWPNTNTSAANPTLVVTNGTDTTGLQGIRDISGNVPEPGDLASGYMAVLQWDEDNTYWKIVSNYSPQAYQTSINLGPIGGVRNIAQNGQLDAWSQGTSFATPASGTETADGWYVEYDGTIGAFSVTRQSFTVGQTTVPDTPKYHFRWDQSSAGSGSSYRRVKIPLRKHVQWRNGEKVTVTLWAKADASRSVTANLVQDFGSGGSPSADVTALTSALALTTSWTKFTLTGTLPSVSGKTLGSALDDELVLYLLLPVNVTLTVDVTNVQVEPGDIASRFESSTPRDIGITAAYLLSQIKTVDGAGSGLDADTVDGYNIGTSGGTIPLLSGNNTYSGTSLFSGVITLGHTPLFSPDNTYDLGSSIQRARTLFAGTSIELGHASDTTITRDAAGSIAIEGNKVWHQGNDGAGSGLDADLLDGYNIGTSGGTIPLLNGNNTWSGVQLFPSGSAAGPSIAFSSSSGTGLYLIGSGQLGISGMGTLGWLVTSTVIAAQNNGSFQAGNASASTPGFGFKNSTNDGFYLIGAGNVGWSIGGTLKCDLSSSRLLFASGVDVVLDTALAPSSTLSVGFRGAPQNTSLATADYTLVLADAGKHLYHTSGSTHTLTIPANGSVAFPIGTVIVVVNGNGAGNLTIAITTDTLRRGDGVAGTGSRTVAANSVVNLVKTGTTEWFISGIFT